MSSKFFKAMRFAGEIIDFIIEDIGYRLFFLAVGFVGIIFLFGSPEIIGNICGGVMAVFGIGALIRTFLPDF